MRKNSISLSSNSSTSSTSFSMPTNAPNDPKLLLQRAKMYETKYPLKILLKSAPGILRNAQSYDREGAKEDAFILYSRYVDLVTNRIATNAELKASKQAYKTNGNVKLGKLYYIFQNLLPSCQMAMERSESLMHEMNRDYNEYKKLENAREEIRELQRRKFLEKKDREEKETYERRMNIERRKSSMHSDDRELLKKLRSLSDTSFTDVDIINNNIRLTSYPTLNEIAIADDDVQNQIAPKLPAYPTIVKGRTPSFNNNTTSPLAIQKLANSLSNSNLLQDTNHKTVNFNEGGAPLRMIFLPSDLPTKFTEIAASNTENNLETCGILVGKLNRNAFFVTHLVIPEQDSTSDTCSTKNEEKMFEYIDTEDPDLFILGWIHTHPTQSCFLSSVDLHTHNSYQIMLNEAIAIVCAPSVKFPKKVGIFRLTDPPGVPTITNCGQTGFHLHEEPNLYVDCNRISNKQVTSGHVIIKKGLTFKIKDLR